MKKNAPKQLQELFEMTEAQTLRRSLTHVFFNFLLHNKDSLPQDFNTIAEDFYFLIRFLDQAEPPSKTKNC